ncbi:MAG TPA: hypothetical protein VNX68_13100 [Nitrosopumilaceae archaeon]|jgi:hypothetical protein|nr:hypothetical protein [Nitrosopumilaceae archaeon]
MKTNINLFILTAIFMLLISLVGFSSCHKVYRKSTSITFASVKSKGIVIDKKMDDDLFSYYYHLYVKTSDDLVIENVSAVQFEYTEIGDTIK